MKRWTTEFITFHNIINLLNEMFSDILIWILHHLVWLVMWCDWGGEFITFLSPPPTHDETNAVNVSGIGID